MPAEPALRPMPRPNRRLNRSRNNRRSERAGRRNRIRRFGKTQARMQADNRCRLFRPRGPVRRRRIKRTGTAVSEEAGRAPEAVAVQTSASDPADRSRLPEAQPDVSDSVSGEETSLPPDTAVPGAETSAQAPSTGLIEEAQPDAPRVRKWSKARWKRATPSVKFWKIRAAKASTSISARLARCFPCVPSARASPM